MKIATLTIRKTSATLAKIKRQSNYGKHEAQNYYSMAKVYEDKWEKKLFFRSIK